ncbi:hypothetical protein ColKHC_06455 [Colletotrichum higginsianum]|nr:hypothetical protein ColKHC_06455 [Colletotrichum higginsianum]
MSSLALPQSLSTPPSAVTSRVQPPLTPIVVPVPLVPSAGLTSPALGLCVTSLSISTDDPPYRGLLGISLAFPGTSSSAAARFDHEGVSGRILRADEGWVEDVLQVDIAPGPRGAEVRAAGRGAPDGGDDLGRHGGEPLGSARVVAACVVLGGEGKDLDGHVVGAGVDVAAGAVVAGLHATDEQQVLADGVAGVAVHAVGAGVDEDPAEGGQGQDPDLLRGDGGGVVLDAGDHVDVVGGGVGGGDDHGADVGATGGDVGEAESLLAEPEARLNVVDVDEGEVDLVVEAYIDVPRVRVLHTDAVRGRVASGLTANVDDDALFADRHVDHGAVHARADV